METLSSPTMIRELLSRHGFGLKKSMGQNFLINPTVCPKMAQLCGAGEGVGVLEVGPGIGVLTAELAKRAQKVVSVELDQRLFPVLGETLGEFSNVYLAKGDILKLDIAALIEQQFGEMPVVFCANLPYYITSPVIMRLLEERYPFASITVMVQKEAAQRLCAQPGTREAGAVSLAVAYYAEAKKLFDVGRNSFYPAPRVDSRVIQLKPREDLLLCKQDEKALFAIIRAAFSQRRKMLANPVAHALGIERERVWSAQDRVGVSRQARAEELTLEEFIFLARALSCFR